MEAGLLEAAMAQLGVLTNRQRHNHRFLGIASRSRRGQSRPAGQRQSKTVITVDDPQVVWITHPHHSLAGQCVAVVRVIRNRQREVVRWVISHPAVGTVSVPRGWASAEREPGGPAGGPTTVVADIHRLLRLAKLVARMASHQSKEENDVGQAPSQPANSPDLGEVASRPAAATHAAVGPAAGPIPGRAAGGDQATAEPGGAE